MVPALSDQALVELLSGSAAEHQYERNVLMTELLNRVHRRSLLIASAREALAAAEVALTAALHAGAPGGVVDAARHAVDAARRHAEEAARAIRVDAAAPPEIREG